MVRRNFRSGEWIAKPTGLAAQVRGAHASRVAMAVSGCTPGGVEALGRFRRHSGSGARRQCGPEAAGCRRGRVRSLDGRRSCPQPVGDGRCCVRVGSLGTAGLGPFENNGGCRGRCGLRRGRVDAIRFVESGCCISRVFREVVGLGTGAAAPAMAHAILEACGWATAVWCYCPPPRWF